MDPKVLALQRQLNKAGYNLKEDGVMGPKTQAALRAYEASGKGGGRGRGVRNSNAESRDKIVIEPDLSSGREEILKAVRSLSTQLNNITDESNWTASSALEKAKVLRLKKLLNQQGFKFDLNNPSIGPKVRAAVGDYLTQSTPKSKPGFLSGLVAGVRDTAGKLLPADQRQFLADLMGSKAPVTERTLTNKEREALRTIVRDNLDKGRKTISYEDYVRYGAQGQNQDSFKSIKGDEYQALMATLGQARIETDGRDTTVVDRYNFNDAPFYRGNILDRLRGLGEVATTAANSGSALYKKARTIGKHFGSSPYEAGGADVRIKLGYGGSLKPMRDPLPKLGGGGALAGLFGSGTNPGAAADLLGMALPAAGTLFGDSNGGRLAQGVLSGVGAGAAFGPIGMGVGAVGGLLMGVLGNASQKRQERLLREEQERQRRRQMGMLLDQREDLDRRNSVAILQQFPTRGVKSAGYYALGGSPGAAYEVEDGEVVQGMGVRLEDGNRLASDLYAVGGDRHEQGGTLGAGGERVYSDRLAVPADLYHRLKNI